MKKLNDLLHPDDRSRLLFSALSAGLFLVIAMLLPLAFRGAPSSKGDAGVTMEDKVLLFMDYLDEDSGDTGLRLEKLESPSKKMLELCETTMRMLAARAIRDEAVSYDGPTGSEYSMVTGADGTELRLCRMWLETRGDWQNWMDVRFDAETGGIYYIYISRECLTNQTHYAIAGADMPDAGRIAAQMAEGYGWTLRYLDEKDENDAVAVFSTGNGTICYQIHCVVYDTLMDIRITCM